MFVKVKTVGAGPGGPMQTYVKIVGGEVVDRAVFGDEMPDDWPDRKAWRADETAQIGWTEGDGGALVAPPPEPIDEKQAARDELAATDTSMARVAEDMWEALKTASAAGRPVTDADLPEASRALIDRRKALREAARNVK